MAVSDEPRLLYDSISSSGVWGSDEEGTDQETPLIPGNKMAEPKDRCAVSYIIFYLLGLGSLLPWNFFITANEYWMYKLRDVNGTGYSTAAVISTAVPAAEFTGNTTELTWSLAPSTAFANVTSATQPEKLQYNGLQSLFMNSLALCAMLPNVIFQFLNTLLQKRIPQKLRVLGTLVLMIILFLITEILVRVDSSSWQMAFFSITLITVVILNSCSAVFQSSVFGVAACFPQKFSGGVMAGQGIGGVFAALAMIMALAFSNNPADSAFIFFLVAIVVLSLTVLLYLCLIKQEFYHYYTRVLKCDKHSNQVALGDGYGDDEQKNFLDNVEKINGDPSLNGTSLHIEPTVKVESNSPPLISVAKKIWLHMFCIVYTFFITLACFPAVTANVKSLSSGTQWTDLYFTPVCCFLLYNLSDWMGRTFASHIHIPSSKNKIALAVGVLARSVFPFLFILCNAKPRHSLPVVFKQDWYFVVFMFLFGFSNGHFSTLCMQYGPKEVDLRSAPTAGSMLAFMISVGLLAGAGMSFALTAVI